MVRLSMVLVLVLTTLTPALAADQSLVAAFWFFDGSPARSLRWPEHWFSEQTRTDEIPHVDPARCLVALSKVGDQALHAGDVVTYIREQTRAIELAGKVHGSASRQAFELRDQLADGLEAARNVDGGRALRAESAPGRKSFVEGALKEAAQRAESGDVDAASPVEELARLASDRLDSE